MKIENPYYSTSSLPTYTHIYWQDDEIHVSSLSLLLKKKMKTTGHHFATNTSPTLLSTHTHTQSPTGPTNRQTAKAVLFVVTNTAAQDRVFLETTASQFPPSLPSPYLPEVRYRGNTRNFSQTVLQAAHDLEKRKKKANATKPNQAADDSPDLTTPNQQQGNREKKKRKKEWPTWGKVARICSRRAGYVPFQLPCEYTWGGNVQSLAVARG